LLSVVNQNNHEFYNDFVLPGKVPGAEPMLYLIDPAGNLMMTYPAVNDPSSILSDMRRLLKISQIG
jgi:predicted proteasome-type protease